MKTNLLLIYVIVHSFIFIENINAITFIDMNDSIFNFVSKQYKIEQVEQSLNNFSYGESKIVQDQFAKELNREWHKYRIILKDRSINELEVSIDILTQKVIECYFSLSDKYCNTENDWKKHQLANQLVCLDFCEKHNLSRSLSENWTYRREVEMKNKKVKVIFNTFVGYRVNGFYIVKDENRGVVFGQALICTNLRYLLI